MNSRIKLNLSGGWLCVIILDGRLQDVHFNKIISRIEKLCYALNMDLVDPVRYVTDHRSIGHIVIFSYIFLIYSIYIV